MNEVCDSALVTDLYELTMMQGYWKEGKDKERAVFDLFYRKSPYGGSFVIAAGIREAVDYVANLGFRRAQGMAHLENSLDYLT